MLNWLKLHFLDLMRTLENPDYSLVLPNISSSDERNWTKLLLTSTNESLHASGGRPSLQPDVGGWKDGQAKYNALQGTITNIQPTNWTIQIDSGYPTDLPLMGTGHLASLYDTRGYLVQNASEVYTGQWSSNGNNSLSFQVRLPSLQVP